MLKEIVKLFEMYFHKKGVKNIYGKEIEVRMQELLEYLRREVLDYIYFLSIKYKGKLRNEKKIYLIPGLIIIVTSTLLITGCIQEPSPTEIPETKVTSDPVVQRAEPYLDTIIFEDIHLRKQAASITSECPSGDKECQINKIYRYIIENYSYYSDPRSSEFIQTPSETMNVKGGDCEDLTILLTSLLENIGIKTYIVLTDSHVYCLACDVNIDHLQEEIISTLNKEKTWYDEMVSIRPHAAQYFGGNGNQSEYPVEIKYSIDASDPVDIIVVPSSESLALWSQGESYQYYSTCSKKNVYRFSDSCPMDCMGGLIIINDNGHSVAVDIKVDIVYSVVDADTFSTVYYSINGVNCVILEPTLGEYGYPGYDTNIIGEKVAIDPITKEYQYLE